MSDQPMNNKWLSTEDMAAAFGMPAVGLAQAILNCPQRHLYQYLCNLDARARAILAAR